MAVSKKKAAARAERELRNQLLAELAAVWEESMTFFGAGDSGRMARLREREGQICMQVLALDAGWPLMIVPGEEP